MLARKLASYRLHMEGITQNQQKCLTFIVAPQGRKNLVRLDQNEEKSTWKIKWIKQIIKKHTAVVLTIIKIINKIIIAKMVIVIVLVTM